MRNLDKNEILIGCGVENFNAIRVAGNKGN